LDSSDVLLTIAEISVAFAAFAGLITVFQRRGGYHWGEADAWRFWQIIAYSFCALFLALFPIALDWLDLPDRLLWGISSATLAVLLAAFYAVALTKLYRLSGRQRVRVSLGLVLLLSCLAVAVLVLQVLNVSGIWFQQVRGPYLVGLIFFLCGAVTVFIRLLQAAAPALESDRTDE
jgi:hypothetical protein